MALRDRYRRWRLKRADFPVDLRRLSQFRPLLDVVDQGEQLPLPIDLALAAQRETIEALVVALFGLSHAAI
jgi:hypothetical protein